MADQLLHALVRDRSVRLVALAATTLVQEAVRRQQAEGLVAVALGRTACAALLIAATSSKDDQRVTLQLHGDGALEGLNADAYSWGGVRVYANLARPLAPPVAGSLMGPPRLAGALGQGRVGVVRDLGLRDRHRGETVLQSGEVDEDVEHYLRQSEQIDSAMACDVILDDAGQPIAAAGVLVQALPGAGDDVAEWLTAQRRRFRAGALADALLRGGPSDPLDLVTTLFPGENAQSLARYDARFYCACSRQRVVSMLKVLGKDELTKMVQEDHAAEIICNFCRERYEVTIDELAGLMMAGAPRKA